MPDLQYVWVRYQCGIGVHTRQCHLKLAQSPREATHVAVHCRGRAVRAAPPHHAPQHDHAALRHFDFTSGVSFYTRIAGTGVKSLCAGYTRLCPCRWTLGLCFRYIL